jgi:hypothetical protein
MFEDFLERTTSRRSLAWKKEAIEGRGNAVSQELKFRQTLVVGRLAYRLFVQHELSATVLAKGNSALPPFDIF